MDYRDLTILQKDSIKEFFNIGAGYAATSLSEFVGKKTDMTVPEINIISMDQLLLMNEAEEEVISVHVRVIGDIGGSVIFMSDKTSMEKLLENLLMGNDILTEYGQSAVSEVGNIITGSYLNAISRFTDFTIMPSVPAFSYDMLAAILSTTFIEAGQYDENILNLETSFLVDDNKVDGHFYYIPTDNSLEKILSKLGTN
ncbi:MAG: chemotaxis protein CheC [Bacillota bacterium]|nr:chemotaxis protein CheC [Bacillota bacterium]